MTEEGERQNVQIKRKEEGKEGKGKSENSNRSEIVSIIIFFLFFQVVQKFQIIEKQQLWLKCQNGCNDKKE